MRIAALLKTNWPLVILVFVTINTGYTQTIKIQEPLRFLALGDSYTIGASVDEDERWPVQFVTELMNMQFEVSELKIIAQTGWRTDVLLDAINAQLPLEGYNLVSLLIGVNNQFQGGSIQDYTVEFEELLELAIQLAGNNPSHVFVLSIPDYAFTPFGNGNLYISEEIDEFNAVNSFIANIYNVSYVNITPISRNGLQQPDLVAGDGLHPSGLQYQLWVQEILKNVEKDVRIDEEDVPNEFSFYLQQDNQLVIESENHPEIYHIFNSSGQKVLEGYFVEPQIRVNLHGMEHGIYFLRLSRKHQFFKPAKFFIF